MVELKCKTKVYRRWKQGQATKEMQRQNCENLSFAGTETSKEYEGQQEKFL